MSNISLFSIFIIALLLIIILGEYVGVDHILHGYIHAYFSQWRQSTFEPVHALLYQFPKVLVGCCMVYWLGAIFFRRSQTVHERLLSYGLAFIYSAMLILLVVFLKRWTDVSCPWSHEDFGGVMRPQSWLWHGSPGEYFECFPAGHATSGFTMLGWLFCIEQNEWTKVWFCGLSWGLVLGLYQMIRGAHYLSHTLITAWIAITMIVLLKALKQYCLKLHSNDSQHKCT